MPFENLEFRFINEQGANVFYGNLGEDTGYRDCKGSIIHVGDLLTFNWKGVERGPCVVVYDDFNKRYFIDGWHHTTPTDNAFHYDKVKVVQPYSSFVKGQIYRDLIHVCEKEEVVGKVKVGNPFTLHGLAANLLSNEERFEPVAPSTDLLYSLFGGSDFNPCPFMPEDLNEEMYKRFVKCWKLPGGHWFYSFKYGLNFSPLAYIRIDLEMDHRPSSYLDRVIRSYYFCPHHVERFRMFLKTIHTPPKLTGQSEEINQTAIELALTVLWDETRTVK